MSEQTTGVPYPDTISLQDAERITGNWNKYMNQTNPGAGHIKAFYIPASDIIDLAALVQSVGGEGVRAYIGLEVPNDVSTVKLAIVPTSGKDPGTDVLTDPTSGVSTIFDFTSPCPQACDNDSPLFNT
jgi:hypothetical protein